MYKKENNKPNNFRNDTKKSFSRGSSQSTNKRPERDFKRDNTHEKFGDQRVNSYKVEVESDEEKGIVIIGRNPVIEALKSDILIDTLFIVQENSGSLSMIAKMAKEQGVVVKQVSDQKLSSLSNGASHQGVVAMGGCATYVEIPDILEIAKEKGELPFIIICDEIEDPHNLGAIIRTAEAAGAHGIIIPKRRSASLNHTVFKTSAGAASWLPVARVANIASAIDELKKNGVWIYGTDSEGKNYVNADLTGSVGLVVGSEGKGVGRLIRDKCDFLVSLPMFGKITSLNASVAGGIFMYEIVRQRYIANK